MVIAMMIEAGLSKRFKFKLWAECVNIATMIENLKVHNTLGRSKYKIFYGKEPDWFRGTKEIWQNGSCEKRRNIKENRKGYILL